MEKIPGRYECSMVVFCAELIVDLLKKWRLIVFCAGLDMYFVSSIYTRFI